MLLHKSNLYRWLRRLFVFALFRRLTRKNLSIFLRGGDLISQGPLIEGIHESRLTQFIYNNAKNGMSDFLIDIGANIGLTSCQNGNSFKQIYCFEPNPLCVNILKTNLANVEGDEVIIGDIVLMLK